VLAALKGGKGDGDLRREVKRIAARGRPYRITKKRRRKKSSNGKKTPKKKATRGETHHGTKIKRNSSHRERQAPSSPENRNYSL